MLNLIDIDKLCSKLDEIKPIVFSNNGLSPRGLQGADVYPTDQEKRFKVTYFPIETAYINPFLIYLLQKHHQKIYDGLLKNVPITFDDKGKAETSPNGVTGLELLNKIYTDKNIPLHPRIRKLLDRTPKEALIAHNVLVIPPAFRLSYQQFASDIDKMYIQLNAKKGRPFSEVQPVIQQLFDQYLSLLKGKSGLLRSKILRRRADFSARFVITVDSTLDTDHVRIPYRALSLLFSPYIINLMLHLPSEMAQKFKSAKVPNTQEGIERLLQHFYDKDLTKDIEDALCSIIDLVIRDRVIIAKRDPVLHQGSIFAFYPIGSKVSVDNSQTMSISPLITEPFNADFDGDTMAVFVPHTKEAIEEAKKLLPSNKRFSVGTGKAYIELKQDYIISLYALTKDQFPTNVVDTLIYPSKENWDTSFEKYLKTPDKSITIKQGKKLFKSTYGRYLINTIANLPNFVNEPFNKTVANKWFNEIAKSVQSHDFNLIINKLNTVTNRQSQLQPTVIDLTKLVIPASVIDIQALQKEKDPEKFAELLEKNMQKVKKYLQTKEPQIYDMIESGARGSWADIQQLMVARGFVADIYGNIKLEPIAGNYANGLSVDDVYASASGWRRGIIDRAVSTARPGYLTRQLVFTTMHTKITEFNCHASQGLTLKVTPENAKSIIGRYLLHTNDLITDPTPFIGKEITIRSPLYCKTKDGGLCSVCYGKLSTSNQVGIIAAHTLGENATQLVLNTFHKGGQQKFNASLLFKSLPKCFVLNDSSLYSKEQMSITLDNADNIGADQSQLVLEPQHILIKTKDQTFEYTLPFSIKLNPDLTPDAFHPSLIKFSFDPNTLIGQIMIGSTKSHLAIDAVESLFHRAHEETTVEDYLFELYQYYSNVSKLPLIHFEVLTSILARQSTDIHLLWRYNIKVKPIILSLKQAISTSSKTNLFFENPGKALEVLVDNPSSKPIDFGV